MHGLKFWNFFGQLSEQAPSFGLVTPMVDKNQENSAKEAVQTTIRIFHTLHNVVMAQVRLIGEL